MDPDLAGERAQRHTKPDFTAAQSDQIRERAVKTNRGE